MEHKGYFYSSFGGQILDIASFDTQGEPVRFKGTDILFEADLVTSLVLFIGGTPNFLHYHPGVTLPTVVAL